MTHPMISSTLASFVLTIIVAYIVKIIYRRILFLRKFKGLPGPKAYPLIGSSMDILFLKRNELMKLNAERREEYKSIYLQWSGPFAEIHLLRPEYAEVALKSTVNITKSLAYDFLNDWLGTGLLTSAGRKWQERRKMITPAFHFGILEDFVETFGEKSRFLVNLLEKKEFGKEFNIYPLITNCALDIICESAMGTPVNAQEKSGSEYVKAVFDVSELILHRALRPWLFADNVWKMSSKGREFYSKLKTLHDFTDKVIMERRAVRAISKNSIHSETDDGVGRRKKRAFLDLLLEASENGHELSQADIREEVDTFMFEGHDTTAASIAWVIFLLGNNPEVQDKVVEELNDIFGDSDRLATIHDLNSMKYLEMVIKETLRLYPSVPFIGRLVTEDFVVGPHKIPAGVWLNIELFNVHRCKDHYPDPEKFNPDNFLPEKMQNRHPFAYVPFSAGPRNCIGQKFALLEEKTVLSSILRKFRVESTEKQEDICLIMDLVLRPESGVKIKMYPRDDKNTK
ncbi:cytochrome P450 4C1 [Nilaparvata lugens]|uniref:cytochrome P450 4C1 n=1 Tax=Nilaparvata lugens TaxID=108931 RepID=UPI00193DAA7B|nr:cytochrome P450 4C1 [Nilaparvata lugens]